MKSVRPLLILLAAISLQTAVPAAATPARMSPLAPGYIERAKAMRDAGNYEGVIDQLRHLDTQMTRLTPEEAREYTFLLADAYYQRDDADCLRLLIEFRNNYPASPLAFEASLAIGDFYFFRHEWADALTAYQECDLSRLNTEKKALYSYHEALCLIKTGHFSEARGPLGALKNVTGYENAYTFYSAYLDYIDGNFAKAYGEFSRVPEGIEGLDAGYYLAQIEFSRGEYEKVISRGTALLRKNPDPELAPEISRIVGLSYFKLDDYDKARRYLGEYFKSVDGEPDDAAVYAMGAIDYADGDYASARARMQTLTDLKTPIGQGAWFYLGLCCLQSKDMSAAALAFEKAVKLDADRGVTEDAMYNYMTVLTRGGKVPFSSSSDLLEDFVKRYPNSPHTPDVETYLATAFYNDHNYAKALQYIESIRTPSSYELGIKQKILYELGVEAVTNGQSEKATGWLQKCVALGKHDRALAAQASLWLGDAWYSLGRYDKAAESYRQFIGGDHTDRNLALGYYDLAYALYKKEDYQAAAANFKSALNARPALERRLADDARIRLGDCLYYTARYAEAESAYSQAIEQGAADSDYALYRRALVRGLRGSAELKLQDLMRVEKDYSQSRWLSSALLEQALTYEEQGQMSKAAEAYKKRLGLGAAADLDELLRMAAAMHESSRWVDLLDVVGRIRKAGGLEPDETAEIDLYEADALAATGKSTEAARIYEVLAVNPSSAAGAKSAVLLAELKIKERSFEEVRDMMEAFTDAGTPHQYWLARGFVALADSYRGLGDTALAREYLSSLNENYPGDEDDIRQMINSRLNNWK